MKTKLDIRKILSSGKSSSSKKLGSIDKALIGLGAKTNYQKVQLNLNKFLKKFPTTDSNDLSPIKQLEFLRYFFSPADLAEYRRIK